MANRRQNDEPLYVQIAESIRRDIGTGRFQMGARLPGSRSMAVALGVSRTVVLMAYEQLESEGYLDSRSGSGTYVSAQLANTQTAAPLAEAPAQTLREPRLSRLAQRAALPAMPEAAPPALQGM